MKKALYILIILLSMSICNKISAYKEYKVGDVVPYNGIDFYVIKDSSSDEESIIALKAEPLTVEEVNRYASNHLNLYTYVSKNIPYNIDGYGAAAYYSSLICGYENEGISESVTTDCKSYYGLSDIKYIVDAWGDSLFKEEDLVIDEEGYSVRLISYNDLTENLGYKDGDQFISPSTNGDTPSFIYENNVSYWTMSRYYNASSTVWMVDQEGYMLPSDVGWGRCGQNCYSLYTIRPVANIKKDAFEIDENDNSDSTIDNETNTDTNDSIVDIKTNEIKTTVKVANTYMSSSIIIIILGFITASVSVLIIYKLSKKKRGNK